MKFYHENAKDLIMKYGQIFTKRDFRQISAIQSIIIIIKYIYILALGLNYVEIPEKFPHLSILRVRVDIYHYYDDESNFYTVRSTIHFVFSD